MFMDYVQNGQGFGQVGEVLASSRFEPGLLRPFFDERGRRMVTINTGRTVLDRKRGIYVPEKQNVLISELLANGINSPVLNATTLRKEQWLKLDNAVVKAMRTRLRAWTDLAAASTYGGFDGMSKMILEHETMNDPGEAVVDMDGLTESRTSAPKWQLEGTPLPITHSDFFFSARRLAISRGSNTPINTVMAEAAGRRVAEMVEKTLLGVETGITYSGSGTPTYGRASTVFGYTNFPSRLTKTNMTAPTDGSWTPSKTVANVLAMRDQLMAIGFYGPFMLYHSTDWDQYLDNDYSVAGGNNPNQTLRNRLRAIEDIKDVRRLDFLTSSTNPFTLLMVQMTSEVAQAVIGMDVRTVQWESNGGMRLNFKVMCIHVPRIYADINGNCGICHGTCS